jgi:hypothetical protein
VEKVKKDEFDFKAWSTQFNKLVDSDLHASRSWRRIRGLGIKKGSLMVLLSLSCDFKESPGYGALAWVQTEGLNKAREATRLAKRLREGVAGTIDFAGTKSQPEVVEHLQKLIEELQSGSKELRQVFSKRLFNPSIFLAWLLSDIEEKCGRPNYRDVAALLEMAYVAHGEEMRYVGEEAIRKTYRRFKQRSPYASLIGPESKRNIVLVLFIVVILHVLATGKLSDLKPTNTGREQVS